MQKYGEYMNLQSIFMKIKIKIFIVHCKDSFTSIV